VQAASKWASSRSKTISVKAAQDDLASDVYYATLKKKADVKVTVEILSVGKNPDYLYVSSGESEVYNVPDAFSISFTGKELKKGAKKTATIKKSTLEKWNGNYEFVAKVGYSGDYKIKITVTSGSKVIGKIKKEQQITAGN
jgi:hypothetical protein